MKIFGAIVVVIGLAGLIYWLSFSTVSWHQKISIEVETPKGVVSASSVTRVVKAEKGGVLAPPEARGVSSKLTGEAVVANLGNGKYLFVLLGNGNSIAQKVFSKEAGTKTQPFIKWPQWAKNIASASGAREISGPNRPLFVTFTDINDPKTVKRVSPYNLEASFGAGYSLKSITLEITDEPVTQGVVEDVLGNEFFKLWTTVRQNARKRGRNDPFFKTPAAHIYKNEFIRMSK